MTKMEMIERFYGRSEELEKKFDAAEKVGDAQTMQACRDAYQELVKEVRAEGEAFGDMMRLYSEMKKRGNGVMYHSGVHVFSSKIRCGQCGSFYGSKV